MRLFLHLLAVASALIAYPSLTWAEKVQPFSVDCLRVEYEDMPMGLDEERPRFSWQIKAGEGETACRQSAYRIRVETEDGHIAWDTGKTMGDSSLNIQYEGEALLPTTRYSWTVDVWDSRGRRAERGSWFETGLLSDSGDKGWSDAKWIGGEEGDMVLYAPYLPVFSIDFSLRLREETTRAAFLYGANDQRLTNANKNIYGLASGRDCSYVKVELDIAPLAEGNEPRLNVYRVAYHPDDVPDKPLASFPIADSLLSERNMREWLRVGIESNLGTTRLLFGEALGEVGRLNLNPLGQGGDFIAFPVLGDVGFCVDKGQKSEFRDVYVRNLRSPKAVLTRLAAEPASIDGGETGEMRTITPLGQGTPMLRTEFTALGGEVAKARLYVTARGIYDFFMNGERVSADYFNPGLTRYDKTLLYQTYDVTSLLLPGQDNAMGAVLAEGWWSGGATFLGEYWNFFGDRQSMRAKLVVTYSDGREQTIVTDPTTWQYSGGGAVEYGSLFQGEVYDARKEALTDGWMTAHYDAHLWKPASEVALENSICHEGQPTVDDYSHFCLTGQMGPTVREVKRLTALSVEQVRPDVYVYDMGQNMVGVPEIRLPKLPADTRLTLRYAEVKYPSLPEYAGMEGMLMLENIRAAMAQDIYVTRGGGGETISPRFTCHGYRYVEITGLREALPLDAVQGKVLSGMHEMASAYETSNEQVNQLWRNITWSARGNFLSIPTDCPQRNERLGWMGDISVFSRTATYLASVPQFLRRFLCSVRDTQHADGRFPDVAPHDVGFGGLLWGSAGITVPWECYQQYGDLRLLGEHYDSMKRYMDYLEESAMDPDSHLIVQSRAWGDLCDWLGLEDGRNDKSLVWEACYIRDLELMGKMAAALGKQDDARHYASQRERRRDLFLATYVDSLSGGTVCSTFSPDRKGQPVDTQTSYALPLAFGIFDGLDIKDKVERRLAETVERENQTDTGANCPPFSLMTGFIGTAWICDALSAAGRTDLAYRLLQNEEYPSWLYPVRQGATTIWERLNSYTEAEGFGGNNRMNSFNHYSFGAVGAWMYAHSLGIQRCENCPGMKHFLLQPEPDPTGQMTWAKGHYDSMYGTIGSSWREEGSDIVYEFTIPANTTASLRLKAGSADQMEGYRKLMRGKLKGVAYEGFSDGAIRLTLQSGHYTFRVLGERF